MRPPGAGQGIEEAPDTGGPWVRKDGVWVEALYGTEQQLTPQVVIPLDALALGAFRPYVTMVTNVLVGGLYLATTFISTTADSNNSKVQIRLVVNAMPIATILQRTFVSAGDTEAVNNGVPVLLPGGVSVIMTEFAQPTSPGVVTATTGGTTLIRFL